MGTRVLCKNKVPRGTVALVLMFFSLTLLVFSPSTVYLTNVNEFSNSFQDLFLAGVLLAAAISLILAVILLGLKAFGTMSYEKGLSLIFAIGFLIWLQGNFLLWNYGPLDGRDIPWSKMAPLGYADGAIWLGVLVTSVVLSRIVVRYARGACLFLLIVQLGYGAVPYSRYPGTANFKRFSIDATDEFVFSKRQNLIIIVLDSFQTDFFDEVIRDSPELALNFEGFTRFRNALAGFPYTTLSVALMLTGRYYDNSLPYERWLKEAYEGNSIPRVLKANGWQVDLFPKISFSVYYSDKIASNFRRGIPFAERIRDVAYTFDLSLFRTLPHFLKRLVYNHRNWLVVRLSGKFWEIGPKQREAITRIAIPAGRKKVRRRHLFPRIASQKSPDVQFVEAMHSESRLGEDIGAFKFYHLGGPHIPFVLDENINYVEMEVNRQNYRKTATATLKLISFFLKCLRQIGVYDRSMILIVGDHGAANQGQEFILQPGMPIDKKGAVVILPYRINALPLMLVKPLDSHGGLKTSDSPVSVSDIPATVFSGLGIAVDVPGESMFSIGPSVLRPRRYLKYSGRDVYAYFGNITEYIVNGPGWMDGSWELSGKEFKKGRTVEQKRTPQGTD